MAEVSTDLIIKLPAAMTVETFTDDAEFEKLYAKVKEAVDQHIPDLSTKSSRAEIASLAHRVARTKTALIAQGKKLTEDWRDKTKKVNAACNVIEERMDALKEDVRRPLTEWEKDEEDRIDYCRSIIKHIEDCGNGFIGGEPQAFGILFRELETKVVINSALGEFEEQARAAHKIATEKLTAAFEAHKRAEADRAELEKLRVEKAERDRVEAERLAAEEAARAETERAERLRQAEIAQKEREERLAEEARKQAERDAQAKVEAAERTAREAQERADREIAEAKARAGREAEMERQRVAAAKEEEEAEQRRRDADKAHRKQVNNNIVAELIECSGISKAQAEKIVVHMVSGLVPNVTLRY